MMADVEKLATSTVAADIPTNNASSVGESNISNADANAAEYGTSPPTLEPSSNSHPHDSEYDTASDLEGGEEYDEDDDELDDDDDDLTGEEEEDDEDDDEIDDDEADSDARHENSGGDGSIPGGSSEKVSDAEIQKKVDEDRSNPQYIPKRGTFYEHDDRMADGDNGHVLAIGDPVGGVESGAANNATNNTKASSQLPSISHASKTMKKWQPASGVDRWSHDRFDEGEQAPKSRSELISTYGYDIRTEDAPPRARRRRRYARGPTKYSRNWEDESAYIKINNKERSKPPRPSDFPALNERPARKPRREPRVRSADNGRGEKENRPERRHAAPTNKSSVNERLNIAAGRSNQLEAPEPREREDVRSRISGRPKLNSRQPAGPGRQAAMEFKPKGRNSKRNSTQQQQQLNNSNHNSRSDDRGYDRSNNQYQHQQPHHRIIQHHTNNRAIDEFQHKTSMKGIPSAASSSSSGAVHMKHNQQQQYHGDNYSSNNNQQTAKYNDQQQHGGYAQQQQHNPQQQMQPHHMQQQQQQGIAQMRQTMPIKSTPPPSNLSQRLQQVQNRNDPSHVGSVQMHALATQNQQLVMGPQPPNSNSAMLISAAVAQQQQQLLQTQPPPPQEQQRGPPKRYSSMRRSQHDAQHLAEPSPQQQQMQQLQHMQQSPQPQPQQTPQAQQQQLIMQDQHSIMQANLLQQLYHQENLQAQMQALQVSQPPPPPPGQQTKQPNYATVPPPNATNTQPPPPTYGANPANAAAYYVTDAYGASGSNAQVPPQSAPYAPQQPTYMAPTPAAALAYTNPPPPQAPAGPPANVYAGPGAPAGPPPTAPNSNPNYSNYHQNYNTVGGTTYFVPPAPTTSRPVGLPQRRPTNAIPILPPSEKNKQQQQQRNNDASLKEDSSGRTIANSNSNAAPIGSAENIDHIIDNMFVQRPAFQPLQSTTVGAPAAAAAASASASSNQSLSSSNSDSISSNVGNVECQTQNTQNIDDSNAGSNNTLGFNSADTNNTANTTDFTTVDEAATPAPASSNASSNENSSNNSSAITQE